jgi:hypothetical protein
MTMTTKALIVKKSTVNVSDWRPFKEGTGEKARQTRRRAIFTNETSKSKLVAV